MIVSVCRHWEGLNLLMKTHMPSTLEDFCTYISEVYTNVYTIDMKRNLVLIKGLK